MSNPFEDLVFSENDIINFPEGIPGFEEYKHFVIVDLPEHAPFIWLVSPENRQLRFAMINPMLFKPEYSPKLNKSSISNLEFDRPEDMLVYSIVTLGENPKDSTANLAGPVLINKTKRLGKQIIIEDDSYSTKEAILKE
ncbi:MAG: flagellar assembly protein FliW [Chitinivibrionales bacterium]